MLRIEPDLVWSQHVGVPGGPRQRAMMGVGRARGATADQTTIDGGARRRKDDGVAGDTLYNFADRHDAGRT